jgi:hypothetical protein
MFDNVKLLERFCKSVAKHEHPTSNFIFVGFGIDKYNLNIFVGTDEFKKTNK